MTLQHKSPWTYLFNRMFGIGTVGLTVIILIFFLIIPIGSIFTKAFIGQNGFTLEYMRLLFSNDLQTTSILNSLQIGIMTTFICTLLTIPLATINAKFDFRGKAILSGMLLVPMIMPPFVGAIGIQRFFAEYGTVNHFLLSWGIISERIDFLGSENMFWSVVVLEVLHLYPIMYLNLSSALSNVDPSLEEMAGTLGASRWRRFATIVWPLARPGYIAGATIIFIWALTDLGTPLLVGYHEVVPVRIFNMVTDINENPVGFALVAVVIVMSVSFFLLSKLATRGKKYEMMARGHVTSGVKKASWQMQWFGIYPFLLIVIVLALVPHITVFISSIIERWFWTPLPEQLTVKYYSMIFDHDLASTGVKNSFLFSSLSTLFDLVLGLFIAIIIIRKMIPYPQLLDAIVMIHSFRNCSSF